MPLKYKKEVRNSGPALPVKLRPVADLPALADPGKMFKPGPVEFPFMGHTVRGMFDENREPWFVAKDIGEALEIKNVRSLILSLDKDNKRESNFDTPGGNQNVKVVNEVGLYSLIFKSRSERAVQFQKFVVSEVMPTIRKYGFYAPGKEIRAFVPMIAEFDKVFPQDRSCEAISLKVETFISLMHLQLSKCFARKLKKKEVRVMIHSYIAQEMNDRYGVNIILLKGFMEQKAENAIWQGYGKYILSCIVTSESNVQKCYQFIAEKLRQKELF